jgi:glutamate-ammonia-ligase adenylyltransferase
MPRSATALTDLARYGFADLRASRDLLDELIEREPLTAEFLSSVSHSADPDRALVRFSRLVDRDPEAVRALLQAPTDPGETPTAERPGDRLMLVLGASEGLASFLVRRPDSLSALTSKMWTVPHQSDYERVLRRAVDGLVGDEARTASPPTRSRAHGWRSSRWARPAHANSTTSAMSM